jgi:hypothetical protein
MLGTYSQVSTTPGYPVAQYREQRHDIHHQITHHEP